MMHVGFGNCLLLPLIQQLQSSQPWPQSTMNLFLMHFFWGYFGWLKVVGVSITPPIGGFLDPLLSDHRRLYSQQGLCQNFGRISEIFLDHVPSDVDLSQLSGNVSWMVETCSTEAHADTPAWTYMLISAPGKLNLLAEKRRLSYAKSFGLWGISRVTIRDRWACRNTKQYCIGKE